MHINSIKFFLQSKISVCNLFSKKYKSQAWQCLEIWLLQTPQKCVSDQRNLISNQYTIKGHSISGDFNYGVNENLGFNAGLVYQKKRKSAVEQQKMIDYYGFNVALALRAIYLKKKELLKKDNNYLKSFFIPSVVMGCSFEYLKPKGETIFYENGIVKQSILTPFLDFKISPLSQFRIGIPIKKYKSVDSSSQPIGPYVQYSLSIANLE